MPSTRSRRRQPPWHDPTRNSDALENPPEKRWAENKSRYFSEISPPGPANSGHRNATDSWHRLTLCSGQANHKLPVAARDEPNISGTIALLTRTRKPPPAGW